MKNKKHRWQKCSRFWDTAVVINRLQPVANRLLNRLQPVANRLHRLPWYISDSSSELRWSWALIFYSFVVLSSTWKLPSMGFQLPLSWEIEFLCTGWRVAWLSLISKISAPCISELKWNFLFRFFSHHVQPLNFDIKKDLAQSDCLKESGTLTNTLR